MDDEIIEGAGPIAIAYYDDPDEERRVYRNPDKLPLFRHRGKVCAFKAALDAHKVAVRKERAELRAEMEKTAAATRLLPVAHKPRGETLKRRARRDRKRAVTTEART
jgi:hypothetical protein